MVRVLKRYDKDKREMDERAFFDLTVSSKLIDSIIDRINGQE